MTKLQVAADKEQHKVISISQRRQITIPQRMFEQLEFGAEAECFVRNNELVIRPLHFHEKGSGEFAEQILSDLIQQGYQGDELLKQFKCMQSKIRPAVEKLIAEADAMAHSQYHGPTLDDIFPKES